MQRRQFLAGSASSAAVLMLQGRSHASPGWANPADAMKAEREKVLFVGVHLCEYGHLKMPDYLAVIDARPDSSTLLLRSYIAARCRMSATSCITMAGTSARPAHGRPGDRRYLIVPGLKSSRIHIIDALDPLKLKLEKVIEPEEIARQANLSSPHTVHCLPDETVMISMLGDAAGKWPRRIPAARSEVLKSSAGGTKQPAAMKYNYDFGYQPRAGVMISTEWASRRIPSAVGFNPDDVPRVANTVNTPMSGIGSRGSCGRRSIWGLTV